MANDSMKEFILEKRQEFIQLIVEGNTPHQAVTKMGVKVSQQTACDYFSMILGYQKYSIVVQEHFSNDDEPTYKASYKDFLSLEEDNYEIITKESKINFDN